MSAASLSQGCVLGGAAWRSAGCAAFNARRPGLPDGIDSHPRCRMTTHGVDDDAITCATASPPPLAGEGQGGGTQQDSASSAPTQPSLASVGGSTPSLWKGSAPSSRQPR